MHSAGATLNTVLCSASKALHLHIIKTCNSLASFAPCIDKQDCAYIALPLRLSHSTFAGHALLNDRWSALAGKEPLQSPRCIFTTLTSRYTIIPQCLALQPQQQTRGFALLVHLRISPHHQTDTLSSSSSSRQLNWAGMLPLHCRWIRCKAASTSSRLS